MSAPPPALPDDALALAAELGELAVVRQDPESGRIELNAHAAALMGWPPGLRSISRDEVRALVHPDDRQASDAAAAALYDAHGPIALEARLRSADGGWRVLRLVRTMQRDAQGRPLAIVGVLQDISEREQARRHGTELGRQLELVTQAAGIAYWSFEHGALRPRWSAQMYALHGLPADQPEPVLADWMQQFVHPADRERVRQQFADWRRSRLTDKELNLRIVRRDGTQRDIFSHTRSDGSAGRTSLFGLVIDVTQRRTAERALQQANERAALAARGAGVGTWETSLHSGKDRWDEQMWRLRGLEPKPEAPSEAERLDLVHPDDHARFGEALERAARHGDAMAETEFRVRLPDGRWRWLASRSVAVPDAQGKPDRRIGVNWDITDKHLAEAARQAQAQALGEVRAKAQLLARMSHELRTPLNAVIGFAQLLLAEDRDDSEAAALRRQRLEHIRSAGRHLLTLINDVLDLASLEGGELRVTMTPVPLAALVAETLPLAEPQARAQGVRLQLDAVEGVALADPTRLRQVLINLLSNAVKYNRVGGVVTVQARRRDGRVVLSVRDNGRGLSEQQIRRLFEPFNRLGAEQEAIEGSGIGLAIVKALVERMGGAVQVTSTPGRGSRFEVILADAEQPTGPLSAAAGTGLRGTLLYIEDNAVNALIVEELVARRSDLRLLGAVDGGQGLALARSAQPDLILLDMQLPDMDGFELLRRLREEPLTAAIPCIALSANAMPADIHRALAAGMLDYWTKPLDFDAFMASLERLFG